MPETLLARSVDSEEPSAITSPCNPGSNTPETGLAVSARKLATAVGDEAVDRTGDGRAASGGRRISEIECILASCAEVLPGIELSSGRVASAPARCSGSVWKTDVRSASSTFLPPGTFSSTEADTLTGESTVGGILGSSCCIASGLDLRTSAGVGSLSPGSISKSADADISPTSKATAASSDILTSSNGGVVAIGGA